MVFNELAQLGRPAIVAYLDQAGKRFFRNIQQLNRF
jgi:hypothetical protein